MRAAGVRGSGCIFDRGTRGMRSHRSLFRCSCWSFCSPACDDAHIASRGEAVRGEAGGLGESMLAFSFLVSMEFKQASDEQLPCDAGILMSKLR